MIRYLILEVVEQSTRIEAVLLCLVFPELLQIFHVGRFHLVVLFKSQAFFFERVGHQTDLDQELVTSLYLLKVWTVQGIADIVEVGVSQVKQLLDGVVVVFARQEEPEMGHIDGSESHGDL
jgi:hypothetical protein